MKRRLLLSLLIFLGSLSINLSFGQQPKLMMPIGHTSNVFSVEFSPDNNYVLTASGDQTAKIWEAISGKLLLNLEGHKGIVFTAHFSPDSKYIVTASLDMTAKIWEARSGRLIHTLNGHTGILYSADFSSDGKNIITASDDETARIWSATTGNLIRTLKSKEGVSFATFSQSGRYIVTTGFKVAKLWNAPDGKLKYILKGHQGDVVSAKFSRNEKYLITASEDSTSKIWDVTTGKMIFSLGEARGKVNSAVFSPDGNSVLTSEDSSASIWYTKTGKLKQHFTGHEGEVYSGIFSPTGQNILTASEDKTAKLWQTDNGKSYRTLYGHGESVVAANFSSDGKMIVTAAYDATARIWDATTGKLIHVLSGHTAMARFATFNTPGTISAHYTNKDISWEFRSGKLLNSIMKSPGEPVTFSVDEKYKLIAKQNIIVLSEVENNTVLWTLKGDTGIVKSLAFSPQGKYFAASWSNRVFIWESITGNLMRMLYADSMSINEVKFSPNEKFLFARSGNNSYKLFNIENGGLIINSIPDVKSKLDNEILRFSLSGFSTFSPDSKYLIASANSVVSHMWETESGKLLHIFEKGFGNVVFNPDGKSFITKSLELWGVATFNSIYKLTGHEFSIRSIEFNSDGRYILTAGQDGNAILWDAKNGKEYRRFVGHAGLMSAQFNSNDKYIITASEDGVLKLWETESGKSLYSFILIDSSDFLIVDSLGHYDGTAAARKLLYFTCGTEVIELDQVKDQLWEPNLAERINNGEAISGKTLNDLSICGLTPEVMEISNKSDEYSFKIFPRRGGLGESVLSVNGIEAKRYNPRELSKSGRVYELRIKKLELNNYFIPGKENTVMLKSYTSDNAISSRGLIVSVDKTKETLTPPNLYAIMIGVSDYKGEELDLKYADKDATDISNAISLAAKKLLKTDDGKEHVFMYNLTTLKERYQLPEKNNIKKLLQEIGTKATANDILLIFFAGHGLMSGRVGATKETEKKQFYFLTADASPASAFTAVADVGISTNELTEWMKPQNIKAQKRIMIFDACNSGQAIRDFVKMGKDDQGYVAARNDDKSQLIKAIDKLNEKSGLFILSASASNQDAYEMGRYSQGLLTYALLKAIKQKPDILNDGKYLDVGRWFDAAKESVTDLAKETGARQQPQVVSNTNFNIGVVDEDLMARIILPMEKPLFAFSNFQNADENIAADNLGLNKLTDLRLQDISTRGANASIVFAGATISKDAFSLSGRYTNTDSTITIKVFIRQNNEVKEKIDLSGTKDKLNEFAVLIADKAAEWVSKYR